MAITAIASDHAGFRLKSRIIEYFQAMSLEYLDLGVFDDEPADYPVFGKAAAQAVLSGGCGRGIIVCGTGIGISIAANRHPGIRAALCGDVFSAKSARAHNDANILALGERVVGEGLALEIVSAFLNTEFSGEERHRRRVDLLDSCRSPQD